MQRLSRGDGEVNWPPAAGAVLRLMAAAAAGGWTLRRSHRFSAAWNM